MMLWAEVRRKLAMNDDALCIYGESQGKMWKEGCRPSQLNSGEGNASRVHHN